MKNINRKEWITFFWMPVGGILLTTLVIAAVRSLISNELITMTILSHYWQWLVIVPCGYFALLLMLLSIKRIIKQGNDEIRIEINDFITIQKEITKQTLYHDFRVSTPLLATDKKEVDRLFKEFLIARKADLMYTIEHFNTHLTKDYITKLLDKYFQL